MALPKREVDVPYGNMAPPERDKHFVNVIVRVSPLRLTRSFAKEAQDDKTQFLFPAPCSLLPAPPLNLNTFTLRTAAQDDARHDLCNIIV
jgi:hypothetical protein